MWYIDLDRLHTDPGHLASVLADLYRETMGQELSPRERQQRALDRMREGAKARREHPPIVPASKTIPELRDMCLAEQVVIDLMATWEKPATRKQMDDHADVEMMRILRAEKDTWDRARAGCGPWWR